MLKVYGLKACDTCRKAVRAFKDAGREAAFHDVRADPLPDDMLARFEATFGDALVNRKSTTWRSLTEDERALPALVLLSRYPALMKRPVIEDGDRLTLGWDKTVQAEHLG